MWFTAGYRANNGEVAENRPYDLAASDAQTLVLKPVETNAKLVGENSPYLYGEDALKKFTMAEGFKIELFASEKEFIDLANPSQIAFDNKGRLWVAVYAYVPTLSPWRCLNPMIN